MAQAVECLPSKCEALSSNPSTTKKEKKIYAKDKGESICSKINTSE
jgi:hypothetical protein